MTLLPAKIAMKKKKTAETSGSSMYVYMCECQQDYVHMYIQLYECICTYIYNT